MIDKTNAAPQIIALTDTELDALHGVGPLSFTTYVLMRAWMDYGTGVTGKTRPVSLGMLASYTETHTPRGSGVQIEQASEKEVRGSLAKLTRAGLLRRMGGDRLVFSLPMALTASARPKQTGQGAGTVSSTEQGAAKAAPPAGCEAEPGTENGTGAQANRAHIMYQEKNKPTRPPVDNSTGVHALCQWPEWAGVKPGTEGSRSTEIKGGSAAKEGAGGKVAAGLNRLLALGEQRGAPPRPGESWNDYRVRVLNSRPPAHRGAQA